MKILMDFLFHQVSLTLQSITNSFQIPKQKSCVRFLTEKEITKLLKVWEAVIYWK